MDGSEMKAWRIKAGWKQPRLAEHLRVTWDRIKNWEIGRSAIPADVAAQLGALDMASPIFSKNEIGPSRLDARGDPATPEACAALPVRGHFYARPWKDPAGHLWYNLRQQHPHHSGKPETRSTYIHLNATTWRHWWDIHPVDPAFMARNLAALDARVTHRRTGNEPPAAYNSAMEDLSKPLAADIELGTEFIE